MKKREKNLFNFKKRKGQVTIFIIIAIVVVALVALFFIFKDKIVEPNSPGDSKTLNPNSFLETCMEDKVEETIQTLGYQGGYIENPRSIEFQFENEPYYNISYLCYTSANYVPCVIQEPSIINHMENKIKNEINLDLKYCFDDLVSSYEEAGYEVTPTYKDFEINLNYDKLIISSKAKLKLTKTGETTTKKDFEIEFPTKLYNILLVSNEIINQEAKDCSFNHVGYMSLYPEYKIDEQNYAPNQTKIYSIEDKSTHEKFRFCVRSCVPLPSI